MALNENPTLEEIVNEVERLNNLIVNRGGTQTITPKTTNQVLSKGYYKGDITVKGDANLIASNIVSGKSIFGVSGNVTASSLGGKKWASGTATSSAGTMLFNYSGSTSSKRSNAYIDVSLNFTPSTIIIYSYLGNGEYLSVFNSEGVTYSPKNVKVSAYNSTSFSTSSYNFIANDKIVLSNNVYRLPVMNSNMSSIWYAYE